MISDDDLAQRFFFLTLQYCIGFAIYQNESATGIFKLCYAAEPVGDILEIQNPGFTLRQKPKVGPRNLHFYQALGNTKAAGQDIRLGDGTGLGHNDMSSTPRVASPVKILTRDCRTHREQSLPWMLAQLNLQGNGRSPLLSHCYSQGSGAN